MSTKTIASLNRKRLDPIYAWVSGDGRGYQYLYDREPTRPKRQRVEYIRRAQGYQLLYRVNVYPKRP